MTLPDSWVLQYEGIRYVPAPPPAGDGSTQVNVTGLGNTGFTLPTLSPTAPAGSTLPSARAVIFSGDGLTSQTRILTGPTSASDTVPWMNALPPSLTGGASGLGKVRVEVQERRYTWLLTMRLDSAGNPNVDVVVFFQRASIQRPTKRCFGALFTIGKLRRCKR